jgi:hypothetical protein
VTEHSIPKKHHRLYIEYLGQMPSQFNEGISIGKGKYEVRCVECRSYWVKEDYGMGISVALLIDLQNEKCET